MYNRTFAASSNFEKLSKLKKVLLGKCPGLSVDQLDKIINAIDIDQQYHIKAVKRIEKFKNIITEEEVENEKGVMRSWITPIYGSFISGFYKNHFGDVATKESIVKEQPMAAVKVVEERVQGKKNVSVSYMLVIYSVA